MTAIIFILVFAVLFIVAHGNKQASLTLLAVLAAFLIYFAVTNHEILHAIPNMFEKKPVYSEFNPEDLFTYEGKADYSSMSIGERALLEAKRAVEDKSPKTDTKTALPRPNANEADPLMKVYQIPHPIPDGFMLDANSKPGTKRLCRIAPPYDCVTMAIQ